MNLMTLDCRRRELAILVALACLTTPFFWLTDLDLKLASFFYSDNSEHNPWIWQNWWLYRILYQYAYDLTIMAACACAVIIVSSYFSAKTINMRRQATYLLLVIALGPGLVVNLIFKDHWGRPRPAHMTEFGGQHHYIPPLQIANTGEKSFTCGHCSVGFAMFGVFFLSQKRKKFYFALTVILGTMLGLTRMSAGGHFVSDILWSGYLVFFVAWLLYYEWYAKAHN
jgi:membrane-associated PAP2 superfamily phosphatase